MLDTRNLKRPRMKVKIILSTLVVGLVGLVSQAQSGSIQISAYGNSTRQADLPVGNSSSKRLVAKHDWMILWWTYVDSISALVLVEPWEAEAFKTHSKDYCRNLWSLEPAVIVIRTRHLNTSSIPVPVNRCFLIGHRGIMVRMEVSWSHWTCYKFIETFSAVAMDRFAPGEAYGGTVYKIVKAREEKIKNGYQYQKPNGKWKS